MVAVACLGVDSPTTSPLDDDIVRDLNEKETCHSQTSIPHGLCLVRSARETIQQATLLLHIGSAQPVLHEVPDQLAGYQGTGIHVGLNLKPKFSFVPHVFPQNVSGRQVHETILLLDLLALRALSSSRWASNHHQGRPLVVDVLARSSSLTQGSRRAFAGTCRTPSGSATGHSSPH